MKIVNTNNTYRIFDDCLRTYDELPPQYYVIRFSKMNGFYMEKHAPLEVKEEKVYGAHLSKVPKVFDAFDRFNRNLGVILSGDKGIGKSLFARMIANEAVAKGIPVVIVDQFYPGIANYIASIEQEVMVLFDEFDKTFGRGKDGDGSSPQSTMLSLFDGIDGGKKLFVVTCNEVRNLNEFLVNRPGRFHYHFRFGYPTDNEIREYLTDKLDPKFTNQIEAVVEFAEKRDINYDCLRSIAFELNSGVAFSEAILDLNIVNVDDMPRFDIKAIFNNGMSAVEKEVCIDMFDDSDVKCWLSDNQSEYFVKIAFSPDDAKYDTDRHSYIVLGDAVAILSDYEDCNDVHKSALQSGIKCLFVKRRRSKNLHYAV